MDYSILITLLRKKQYLTDLEKDILDTWNELQKNPFDMDSAARQVLSNDAKYMDIAAMVFVRRRTPHCAQENSTVLDCSVSVLIGSWQTGQRAFSPLDWSNTTMFPQCGHSRPASLSVRTLIV